MIFSLLLKIYEMNRKKVVGLLNFLKLKQFAILGESNLVVSIRGSTQMKMFLAARKPNGFDLHDYQEEATTPTTKPKPHNQFGFGRWRKIFDTLSMFCEKHQFCLYCSITVQK